MRVSKDSYLWNQLVKQVIGKTSALKHTGRPGFAGSLPPPSEIDDQVPDKARREQTRPAPEAPGSSSGSSFQLKLRMSGDSPRDGVQTPCSPDYPKGTQTGCREKGGSA